MGQVLTSGTKDALVDIDRDAEFTGDDVDQYSKLVDLGGVFENVLVYIPTITSATVTLCLQRDSGITTVPLPLYILDTNATGNFLSATTAATTTMAILFKVGGVQYFRVKCGANQSADVTFYCVGC